MDFGNNAIPEDSTLGPASKSNELQQAPFYSIVGSTEVLPDNNDLAAGIPISSDTPNAEDILFFKDENGLVYYTEDQNNIVLLSQDSDLSQFITEGNYQQVVVSEASDHGIVLADNGYETVVTSENNEQNVAIVNNNEYQMIVADNNDQATPIVEQDEQIAIMAGDHEIETSVVETHDQEIITTSENNDKTETSENYAHETAIINDPGCETEISQNIALKSSISTNESQDSTFERHIPDATAISNQDQGPVVPNISDQNANINGNIIHETVVIENNVQETTITSDNGQVMMAIESGEQKTSTINFNDQGPETTDRNDQEMETISEDAHQKMIEPEKRIQNISTTSDNNSEMPDCQRLTIPNNDETSISSNNALEESCNGNDSHQADGVGVVEKDTDSISNDKNDMIEVKSNDENVNVISNDVSQNNDEYQIVGENNCKTVVPESNDLQTIEINEPCREVAVDDCKIDAITTTNSDNHDIKKSQNDCTESGNHTNDKEVTMHDSDSHDIVEEYEYIVEEVIEFDDASQHEVSQSRESKGKDNVILNDDDELISRNSSCIDSPKIDKLRIKEDIVFSKSGVRKPVRTYERKNKNVVPYKSDNQVRKSQILSKDQNVFVDDGCSPDFFKSSPRTSHKHSPLSRHESSKLQDTPKKSTIGDSSPSDKVKRSPSKQCKYDDVKLFEELEDDSLNHESYLNLHPQHVECANMIDDSSFIDLESSLSPKKRRGRPPKLKSPRIEDAKSPNEEIKQNLLASNSGIDSMHETGEGRISPVSSTEKRPTMHQAVSEPTQKTVDEEKSVLDGSTPKKRGRRPKVMNELNSTAEDTFNVKTPSSAMLPKRRSGRPPRRISDHPVKSNEKSDDLRTPKNDGAEKLENAPDATDASSPPKKRRGRPPRASLVPNSEQNIEKTNDSLTHTVETCQISDADNTRKSDATMQLSEPGSLPLPEDSNLIPKRDERKSRVSMPETDMDDIENVLVPSTIAIPQNVEEVKILKRKRGRQSKASIDAEKFLDVSKTEGSLETSVNKDVSVDSVVSPKKRRGRPPKVRASSNGNIENTPNDQNSTVGDGDLSIKDGSQDLITNNTPVLNELVEPSPKKRGRRSKIHDSSTAITEQENEYIPPPNLENSYLTPNQEGKTADTSKADSVVPAPKRRGRPPKVRDSLNESVTLSIKQEIVEPPTDVAESNVFKDGEHIPDSKSCELTAPLKKRRGRQPKNRDSLLESSKQENLDSPSAMDIPIVQDETPSSIKSELITPMPKRKGRPPKIRESLVETSEELAIKDDKVITPIVSDADSIAQANTSEHITSELITPAPRRRGRLPKIRHSLIESSDPTKEVEVTPSQTVVDDALHKQEHTADTTPSESTAVAPKRRGRAPKLRESLIEAPKEPDTKSDVSSPLAVNSSDHIANVQDGDTNVVKTDPATSKVAEEEQATGSHTPSSENVIEQIESVSCVETAESQDDTPKIKSELIVSPHKRPGRRPKRKHWRLLRREAAEAQKVETGENSPNLTVPEIDNPSIPNSEDKLVNTVSASPTAIKKKRGRQPKQTSMNNSIQDSLQSDTPDSRSSEDNTESRLGAQVETLETEIPNQSVPPQKRRGRQPKSLAPLTQSTTESTDQNIADSMSSAEDSPLPHTDQDELADVSNAEPLPKRRGRKPKAPVPLDGSVNIAEKDSAITTVEVKNEQPDSNTPVQKRKGRPPKNRSLAEQNDSKSNQEDILVSLSSTNDAETAQKNQDDTVILHAVPPQKRRGRQPKNQSLIEGMEVDSENRDQNSSQVELSSSQRDNLSKNLVPKRDSLRRKAQDSIVIKRRSGGRPRKISEQAIEDIDPSLVTQTSGSLQKRKRGRQPKVDTSHYESTEEEPHIPKKLRKVAEPVDVQSPPKKRRGRPPRSEAKQGTTPDMTKISKQVDVDVKVKRRGRRPKQETNPSSDESNSNDQPLRQHINSPFNDDEMATEQESDDEIESDEFDEQGGTTKSKMKFTVRRYKRKRKPGRPRAGERQGRRELEYQPHHSFRPKLPKRNKEKVISPKTSNTSAKVTCGKCDLEVPKRVWIYHNLKRHNDLGWIAGTEKPDYENDDKLLKRVLFDAIKKRSGSLICEICNEAKRSVLGYLSHVTFCGKSEEEIQALMVTCPECQAVMRPSSFEHHERMHKQAERERERKEIQRKSQESNMEVCDTPGVKSQRKAAQKAVTRISEFTAHDKYIDEKGAKISKEQSDSINNYIDKPRLKKRIPNFLVFKWKKNLEIGIAACCRQPGCQFTTKSLDEMKQHYSTCNFKPRESYMCRLCKFQSMSHTEILDHALREHPNDGNDGESSSASYSDSELVDDDDFLDVNKASKFRTPKPVDKSDPSYKMFSFVNQNELSMYQRAFLPAFQWTLEFERENFKLNLFQKYMPNIFKRLEEDEMSEYLPELDYSMLMKCKTVGKSKEREWQSWKRFEGGCTEDIPTFFVGGPVWAIAWLPIPTILAQSRGVSQYIAISTHRTMDVEYSIEGSHSGKNIIQIWNLGALDHRASSTNSTPKLEYSIIHEGGTIWHLEWCPSGCYQNENVPGCSKESHGKNRMGLLAAACSDGCVRIYSLVFAKDLPLSEQETKYPVYDTAPVVTLVLDQRMYENKLQSWQVTKLSWSRESGHNVIAAGFSNGYVALWDLASESPLFKFTKNDRLFLIPVKQFHPHFSPVTMVHLIPQDGRRFLATASLDRYYKLWDLECLINPIDSFQRGYVTDGSWMNHWGCALLAYDDALSMTRNYSLSVPTRAYTYRNYNVFPAGSTCYSISGSDFGNSIASGTLAGEVLVMFPPQMLYLREMERIVPRKRQICRVSYIKTVELDRATLENASPSPKKNQPKTTDVYDFKESTYEDSKDRYGLELCVDMSNFKDGCISQRLKRQKKSLTCDSMNNVPIEQYPFMSVNRVSWNPNAWSYLWLAVGYQNGFVQLLPFKALASKAANEKILTPHIESLLDSETGASNES